MLKMPETVAQWLAYIATLHPLEIDLGLARIGRVAQSMQLIKFDCPVVMIAGTNGKGSCVAALSAIYQAAGYHVGSLTSPHLVYFNERITINGEPVTDAELLLAFAAVESARLQITLSYFEFTTLAGLWLLQRAGLDVVLLEVGLGGRLDATNVVENDVAVITSIALDHMDLLGHDRESIGREKAGIMRAAAVAVCGEPELPQSIVNVSLEVGCELYQINKDFFFEVNSNSWDWRGPNKGYSGLPLAQLKCQNMATSLMVVDVLQSRLAVTQSAIEVALAQLRLVGRYECTEIARVPCVFDVAHNPAATAWLAQQLAAEQGAQPWTAIVGMMADKDIAASLQPLLPVIDTWYPVNLEVERASSAAAIAAHLSAHGAKNCYTFDAVAAAWDTALASAKRIVVFGSFYTVMAVKQRI